MDKDLVASISQDQFKVFFLEQIKRAVKKLYKNHLQGLDKLQQEQLRVSFENQKNNIAAPEVFGVQIYSTLRKAALDDGNETIREIENLFNNIDLTINNKNTHE